MAEVVIHCSNWNAVPHIFCDCGEPKFAPPSACRAIEPGHRNSVKTICQLGGYLLNRIKREARVIGYNPKYRL
ncbi:hypothetical protein RP20_CCG005982 [Aedes albopictus]|nr:hypothetical protein RP20_CCG005982 [Aedes albopictus]